MTLNTLDLTAALGEAYSLEYHVDITSTNDVGLERARTGAAAGTVICAETQQAGRGRRGAAWFGMPGSSALFSIIFRPAVPLPPAHWAILTGVGVAKGLHALEMPVKIKWPNDLLLDNRKVGGILVETTGSAVVVGVGINCAGGVDDFPAELQQRAGTLAMHGSCPQRERVVASVVHGVADAYARVEAGGILKVLYDWNTMNWYSKRKVRVSGPMGVVEGDGLFLDGRKLVFHVFKDHGVVPMPLSSTVEAR